MPARDAGKGLVGLDLPWRLGTQSHDASPHGPDRHRRRAMVIKFFNGESIDSPQVEHACMTLAAKAGINVAQTQIIAVNGLHALLIRRFDRLGNQRVHCISAGTAIRASTVSVSRIRRRVSRNWPASCSGPASLKSPPTPAMRGICSSAWFSTSSSTTPTITK